MLLHLHMLFNVNKSYTFTNSADAPSMELGLHTLYLLARQVVVIV